MGRRSATKHGNQHEVTAGYFDPLRSARYLLLTTFREDSIPVSTHVHGLVEGDRAYFRTWHQSGAARRLRHTDDVQVTACSMPGLTVGAPLDAVARLLSGAEADSVAGKLARKYPLHQRFLVPLLHRIRRWQLAHYELLSYEAAVSDQDLTPTAASTYAGPGSRSGTAAMPPRHERASASPGGTSGKGPKNERSSSRVWL
jgi:PPOX class probable F420-dependent enzyme